MSDSAALTRPDLAISKARAAFQTAWDAERSACDGPDNIPQELSEAVYASLEAVRAFSPVTLEGVRAKARVGHLMGLVRQFPPGCDDWRSQVELYEQTSIEILADLAGVGRV